MAAALAATFGLAATPAWADGVTVRSIDTRDYPAVRMAVLVDGAAPNTTDFHLRENGEIVADSRIEVRPLKQTTNPVGTVLVIDTSGSMKSRGAIDQAKAAARQFIAAKAPNDWIALVSISSQVLVGAARRWAVRLNSGDLVSNLNVGSYTVSASGLTSRPTWSSSPTAPIRSPRRRSSRPSPPSAVSTPRCSPSASLRPRTFR